MYTGRRVGRLVSSSLKMSPAETRITCLAHFQLESKNLTEILIKLLVNTFFCAWPLCWNVFNPLSTNPQNGEAHKTICWLLPMNCLSVFDHFVGLVLKGLITYWYAKSQNSWYYFSTNFCFDNLLPIKNINNGLQGQILMFLQNSCCFTSCNM